MTSALRTTYTAWGPSALMTSTRSPTAISPPAACSGGTGTLMARSPPGAAARARALCSRGSPATILRVATQRSVRRASGAMRLSRNDDVAGSVAVRVASGATTAPGETSAAATATSTVASRERRALATKTKVSTPARIISRCPDASRVRSGRRRREPGATPKVVADVGATAVTWPFVPTAPPPCLQC